MFAPRPLGTTSNSALAGLITLIDPADIRRFDSKKDFASERPASSTGTYLLPRFRPV
jgi:hypothetical protein